MEKKMTAVEALLSQLQLRLCVIKSEPDGIVRETMISDFLIDADHYLSMEREQMGTCYRDGMWEGMKTSDEKAQTFTDYFTQNYGDEK